MSTTIRSLLTLPMFAALCLAQVPTAPSDGRVAKIYEVGDLVDKWDASSAVAVPGPAPDLPPIAPASKPRPDAIVRLLKAFVKPELASDEEIRGIGERWIVALVRAEQHAWIERFLQSARSNEAKTVLIECSCYSTPELVFLRDIRDALVPKDDAEERDVTDPKFVTQVLAPGAGTDAFLKALVEHDDVSSLFTPGLEVWPLTSGHVAVIDQTAYVRDFDVKVAKSSFIANPIVDVIKDGISIETAVYPLEDGAIGLSLDVSVADLQRPIQIVETTLPGTTMKVKVQLPNVKTTQLEAAFELQPGSIAVLAPPPLAGTRHLFVVKVTAGGAARRDK